MKPYPDDLTYKLVGAACEVLNASAEDVLKAFGEYWILFTAEKGYGEMLNFMAKINGKKLSEKLLLNPKVF